MVDFIVSLDGYASAEGWPGWWGLEGPEYLAWLEQEGKKDYTFLMGANTYRLMSSMSEEAAAEGSEFSGDEGASLTGLAAVRKVVFSSTLQAPLTWPNSELVTGCSAGPHGRRILPDSLLLHYEFVRRPGLDPAGEGCARRSGDRELRLPVSEVLPGAGN